MVRSRARRMILGMLLVCALPFGQGAAGELPLLIYATQSGHQTLDQGEGGGNPFASALIELLQTDADLVSFTRQLVRLTEQKSGGFQQPQIPYNTEPRDWQVNPIPPAETRVALVIVFSDYYLSRGAASLPGALRDAERVSAALTAAGFVTETVADPDPARVERTLANFAQRSQEADVAALYATGHGVEVNRQVYVLPGDYPVRRGNAALPDHAYLFSRFARAAQANRLNMVFWGGCRDNPLGGR